MITRADSAEHVNMVLNHPGVRPDVANGSEPIDLTAQISDSRNVVLQGEHGVLAFLWAQPGVYEAHTAVLPAWRGVWTRLLTEAAVKFMFCQTDAYEITTRIPGGHPAAKAAALAQGMRHEFTRPDAMMFHDKIVDLHVYSFRIQDWAARAPDLTERGQWFHRRLHEEAERLGIPEQPHEDDENHNRYVGAAIEMAFGGQFVKAVNFYNRWVSLARQTRDGKLQYVSLVSAEPLVVRFDAGLLQFHANDIEVMRQC